MMWIKELFRKPTPLEKAARELANLEHEVLEATGTRDWAQHRISYSQQRMAYLKQFLATTHTGETR